MFECLKILGTFTLGSLMLVSGLTLTDKALTPLPVHRECHPQDRRLAVENECLRSDVLRLKGDLAQTQADYLAAKCRNEQLMRVAIFPPMVPPAEPELIPAQHLPTQPEGAR